MGNWPINHFLKTHFNNRRAYEKGKEKGTEKGLEGKSKLMKFNIAYEDIYNFGTDQKDSDEDSTASERAK